MKTTLHATAGTFLETAAQWLKAEEAVNNLILGLAANISARKQAGTARPLMMTVADRRGLRVAALMTTPPQHIQVYAPDGPDKKALSVLAGALKAGSYEALGCMGPAATARAFADIWTARTRKKIAKTKDLLAYELRRMPEATDVAGRLRVATATDESLAAKWHHAFVLEAIGNDDAAASHSAAARGIANESLFFWEDGGQPVCQAYSSRRTRRGIAIGAVYTPPEFRGRGYGTACVTALSRRQLEAGREFCCLYADKANPTANGIYRRIGYVPVADIGQYSFTEATHA
ncbi:MAG: GNAT family N-acetyltransferase [Planctomycetes bacterium]|nr:GNAT family N-acetyltransferase [Planctomycetota bacterium]